MVLRKSLYIHWSAGRSPRVDEVNPGRDPSTYFLSCSCTLNVHERYGDWLNKSMT